MPIGQINGGHVFHSFPVNAIKTTLMKQRGKPVFLMLRVMSSVLKDTQGEKVAEFWDSLRTLEWLMSRQLIGIL